MSSFLCRTIYDARRNSWQTRGTPECQHAVTGCAGCWHTNKNQWMCSFSMNKQRNGRTAVSMETCRSWCSAVSYRNAILVFLVVTVPKTRWSGTWWNQVCGRRFPAMPRKRSTCCAVRIGSKVTVLGGVEWSGVGRTAVKVFDLDSMVWDANNSNNSSRCSVAPPQKKQLMFTTERDYCCAVSIRHTLIGMGGRDDNGKHLTKRRAVRHHTSSSTPLPPSLPTPSALQSVRFRCGGCQR